MQELYKKMDKVQETLTIIDEHITILENNLKFKMEKNTND